MALSREVMGGGFSSGQAQALGGGTNSAVASAGSVQGDGTVISTSSQIVTGADGTKGVTLPAAPPGDSVSSSIARAQRSRFIHPAGRQLQFRERALALQMPLIRTLPMAVANTSA